MGIIMKFLLLIAAIASVRAEAEANPAFTYTTGYLPYAYGAPLPTPTHLSSTPLLPDVRTKPVPWCLAPTVVLFPSESSLPQLHPPLLRPRLKLTPRRILGCSTAPM